MAKYMRKVVGSVVKSKDPSKPDYIKVRDDVTLKKGQFLNLESAKFQLASLEDAVKAGKLSEANASKARERIKKVPDWVRFEIVLLERSE